MNYNYIIDPITYKSYNLDSIEGINILNNYVSIGGKRGYKNKL